MQVRLRIAHFFGILVVLLQPSAKRGRCFGAVPRQPKHPRQSQGRTATNAAKARSRGTAHRAVTNRTDRRHLEIGFVGNGFEPDERDVVRLGAPGHRRRFHVHGVRPVGLRQLGFLLRRSPV